MKVLVIPSWYPLYGNFFLDQSIALANKGIKVDILVNDLTSLKDFGITKFIKNFKINATTYSNVRIIRSVYWKIPKSEKLNIKLWIKKTSRLFKKYMKRYGRPDLIHAHSSVWAGYATSFISAKLNIPYIITEHKSRFVYKNNYALRLIKPFYIKYIRQALYYSSFTITVSKSMIDTLLEIEPSLKNKIEAIPNMTDTGFFTLPQKDRQTEPFIFLSAGLLEEAKGMDVLLKAFSLFSGKFKDSRLRIAGEGILGPRLKRLCGRLKISGRVKFLGNISKESIRAEYQAANAFVLASRFEAFGVVFIEALSSGLPVIGTKSGGPEEIINDKVGYLTAIDNVDQLADAMERLYKNYSMFDPEKIRQYAIDNYSEDIIADQIIKKFNYVTRSSNKV
jgi:glycosyltransferase involved in cell wall biosynthesis